MRYSTGFSVSLTLLSWVAAVRSQNCQLKVPQNPLTAKGLATPYELTGCNQIDFANQGAFVEAAILDPSTGKIEIYNPLVINAGMVPVTKNTKASATVGTFIPPLEPQLPKDAVVGIWFGSNANTLTLTGDIDGCVNGLPGSVFGQFAYCNGKNWFNEAKETVQKGLTKIPAPGTGTGGQACPTTHDFRIVDMDQSDNLITTYLLLKNGTLAQNTPANSKANPTAEVLSNASDNALVTEFIDPALGCTTYQNPCTTCPTGQGASLATDELQAFFFPPVGGPALISLNDDFVTVNGAFSLDKVNLYREGTGQPIADNNNASAVTYCKQISLQGIFLNDNKQLFSGRTSPVPAMANNLFTFLAMRFSTSLGPAPGLGCTGLLNIANPVTLTMNGNGVVTDATFNIAVFEQLLGKNVTTSATSTKASTTGSHTSTAASGTKTSMANSAATHSTTPTGVKTTSAASESKPATSGAAKPTSSAAATESKPATSSTANPTGSKPATPSAAQPTSSAATTSAPSGVLLQNTATPTATHCPSSAATVTVTVTATVCPTHTSSTPAPSQGNENGNEKRFDRSARMYRKNRF